jgi:acetyl-CoA synthetase
MRAAFEWDIPEVFNIAQGCCDSWAEVEPDRVAIVDLSAGRRVWTYGQLKAASDRLAGLLASGGVGRGDRVAILLPQRAEVMVAHFAAMKLGAVSLPLFSLFGPEALEYRLRDSGATAVITDSAGLERVAGLTLPDVTAMVDVDDWNAVAPIFAPVETRADDPAMMIYTSGTTGTPKGVLHAHRFLYGHLPCVETALEGFPVAGDVGWTPADWAWIGGLMDLALPCLWFGVPLVAKRFGKFEADDAWDLMVEEGVTAAFLPPTALKMLRRTQAPEGLRLRAVLSGGEALGAGLLDWGRDALGVCVNEIYGQTECNLVMASCAGTQDVTPGTLGRAVPGMEVEVQGADGAPVAVGEVGEICTRGSPAMFLRYWQKPDETAAKYRDGWLRTGDLGRAEGDGVARRRRDHIRRIPHRPGRDRDLSDGAPGGGDVRRRGVARRLARGGGDGLRGRPRAGRRSGGGVDRLGPRAAFTAYGPALGALRRRAADDGNGQDPAPGFAGGVGRAAPGWPLAPRVALSRRAVYNA